ncbi:NAD(P)/FAD-dependent oxidoreductase [Lacticigenium naphthae]|uniref:NAD(P)/FAD-dependent oxidoreductase n=1 Tax=Lacticigenium naphthae TaxID=515351 RepID=UPI003CCBB76D
MSEEKIYDITVIGGGPVGMFTAFYAGLRNAKVKIIETLPVLGGQVSLLYPDKTIYDVAGFPRIKGTDLIEQLEDQMEAFDQTICLEEEVLTVTKTEAGYFELKTNKDTHYSKTVIVTVGKGAFIPRKLKIPGAEIYETTNLHYLVSNIEQYRNKKVAICGGGDSAVDWALTLKEVAEKVYLVHRRDKFRAHEYPVSLVKNSSVEVLTPYVPTSLSGDRDALETVTFTKVKSDESLTLDVDYFVVNYGFTSTLGPVKNWGLNTLKQEIVVNPKMETSVAGIYAAGDIATYEGKIKLIATGFGEAPTAVNHAIHYIHPEMHTQPAQSTSLDFTNG